VAVAALAPALLAACGAPTPHPRNDADTNADTKVRDSTGSSTEETVFDDLIQTKDKARSVEGVLQEGKAATDKAIEESEGGGSGDQ
jgi:hypothetical protein